MTEREPPLTQPWTNAEVDRWQANSEYRSRYVRAELEDRRRRRYKIVLAAFLVDIALALAVFKLFLS